MADVWNIGFRAWRDYSINSLTLYAGDGTYEGDTLRENIILMQFTGLLDRNGKEIYEGDVVQLIHEDGFRDELGNRPDDSIVGVVTWRENGFNVSYEHNDRWHQNGGPSLTIADSERVLLGNIHENPELVAQ